MSEVIFHANKTLAAFIFNVEEGIETSVKDNARLIFSSSSVHNEQYFLCHDYT